MAYLSGYPWSLPFLDSGRTRQPHRRLAVLRARMESVQATYLGVYARVSLPFPAIRTRPSVFPLLTVTPEPGAVMPACGVNTRLLLRTGALEVTDGMVENAGHCALQTTAPQMKALLRKA